MALPDLFSLLNRKRFGGKFPERFQHTIAHRGFDFLTQHEGSVTQLSEVRERVRLFADLLCGLQRPPPVKDGEAGKEELKLRGEQAIAPLNRGTQRAMARREVAMSTGKQIKATLQPLESLCRRQYRRPRRRQLRCQWDAFELRTERGNGRSVFGRETKIRPNCPHTIQIELNAWKLHQALRRSRQGRNRQRAERKLLFPTEVQTLSGSDQAHQRGKTLQKLPDHACTCLRNLFEIV